MFLRVVKHLCWSDKMLANGIHHMSFASCTGTTKETCRPPCALIYNTDTQDAACVPPLAALSASLSDADIDQIRALIGTLGAPSANTAELAESLRALHADLRVYVNNRIRLHTNNTTQTDWHLIVKKIIAELLNDTKDLACPVCLGEVDESEPVLTLECIHPQSTTHTPIHARCTRDLLRRGNRCPMCRTSLHTNHGDEVLRRIAADSIQSLHDDAWEAEINSFVGDVILARRRRDPDFDIDSDDDSFLDDVISHRDAASTPAIRDFVDMVIDQQRERAGDADLYVLEFPGITRRIVGPTLLVMVIAYLAASILYAAIGTAVSAARPTIDRVRLPVDRARLARIQHAQDPHRQLVATGARSLPWQDPNAMPPGYEVGDLTPENFELGFDGKWYIITDHSGRPMTGDTPLSGQIGL